MKSIKLKVKIGIWTEEGSPISGIVYEEVEQILGLTTDVHLELSDELRETINTKVVSIKRSTLKGIVLVLPLDSLKS